MPNESDLKTAYTEVCASYHRIDDFRAKLLALLPSVSGAGVFFVLRDFTDPQRKIDPRYVTASALLGLFVSLGLYFYELRGVQRCICLSKIARDLESGKGGMSVVGQFTRWPHSVGRFINEPIAAAMIYSAVLSAWVFIAVVPYSSNVAGVVAGAMFIFCFLGGWMFYLHVRDREYQIEERRDTNADSGNSSESNLVKPKLKSLLVVACASVVLSSAGCAYFSKRPDAIKESAVSSPTPAKQESAPASPLPSPTGFVNDYAAVFDRESKTQLESVLTELRNKAGIEFAVVTVETTAGQSLFDYSLAVAKGWGIGPKDTSKGGGLLLMLSIKDRAWRLQVSKNLEKDLPDEVCLELGEPSKDLYRQGKYAEGARKYVKAIIKKLEGLKGFKLSSEL